MSPQEQSYLRNVNRNVKISPFLTALLTGICSTIATSFTVGRYTARAEARMDNVESEVRDVKGQISELKPQVITNTADIRSLKDWRLEFKK